MLTDQNGAFAPHGFAYKCHSPARTIERGRVELHKFEIGELRPGTGGKGWAVPKFRKRVGCVAKQPPMPPAASTTRRVGNAITLSCRTASTPTMLPSATTRRSAVMPSIVVIERVLRAAASSARNNWRPVESAGRDNASAQGSHQYLLRTSAIR